MAESKGQAEQGAKKKSPIPMILVMLGLMGASIGGTLFFVGAFTGGEGGEDSNGKAEQSHQPEATEAHYFAFTDPFTVNFETETGMRFIQMQLEVMSHDATALQEIEAHMPVIRNNIIFMLSSQPFLTLIERDGKEQLRAAILENIREVLKERTGHASIEQVYFTGFVIQ